MSEASPDLPSAVEKLVSICNRLIAEGMAPPLALAMLESNLVTIVNVAGKLLADLPRGWKTRLEVADEMETLLRGCEWVTSEGGEGAPPEHCPACERKRYDGHAPDCRLAGLLARIDAATK